MTLTDLNGYCLAGLGSINLILGKNGCGKSYALRRIEEPLRHRVGPGTVRYLSPERAGTLEYSSSVEQHMTSDPAWLGNTRRQNQVGNFRQQSAAQYRRLELLMLRDIEQKPEVREDASYTFDVMIDRLNTLLDRVYLVRGDFSFALHDRETDSVIGADSLSSGESELISLGLECLAFGQECSPDQDNFLLIDEPDVHLHPDLQARFATFLTDLVEAGNFRVLLATHSTALVSAMGRRDHARLTFMKYKGTDLMFSEITATHRRILPVFGAHPLSNVFNEKPILLVEGDDDVRIWQQVVRSSEGRIALYPVPVVEDAPLAQFEQQVAEILKAVYDDATGYSLRDRDDGPEEIVDILPVRRFRLACRSAENLLLTDQVLQLAGRTWEQMQSAAESWLNTSTDHVHYSTMRAFADGGFDRKSADVKEIRNDLLGLMGTNKPWETLVGQAIAGLSDLGDGGEGTLQRFLGQRVCEQLLGLKEARNEG